MAANETNIGSFCMCKLSVGLPQFTATLTVLIMDLLCSVHASKHSQLVVTDIFGWFVIFLNGMVSKKLTIHKRFLLEM